MKTIRLCLITEPLFVWLNKNWLAIDSPMLKQIKLNLLYDSIYKPFPLEAQYMWLIRLSNKQSLHSHTQQLHNFTIKTHLWVYETMQPYMQLPFLSTACIHISRVKSWVFCLSPTCPKWLNVTWSIILSYSDLETHFECKHTASFMHYSKRGSIIISKSVF